MKKALLTLLGLVLVLSASAGGIRIRVAGQEDFDLLPVTLRQALSGEESEVDVWMEPGAYVYRDRHLNLDGWEAAGKTLRIMGEGAVLYPETALDLPFRPETSYYLPAGDSLAIHSPAAPIAWASFLVWVSDRKEKICRLRLREPLDPSAVENGYIYLTQWFKGRFYKICGVKGRYVYFRVHDLRQQRLLYSVNTDWTFSAQFPRYRLINCKGEYNAPGTRQAVAATFMSLGRTRLDTLDVRGLRFVGNARLADAPDNPLVSLQAAESFVRFRDCRFENLHSDVFRIDDMSGVTVEHCLFSRCGRYCVHAGHNTADVSILDNRVAGSGADGSNIYVFACYGRHFRISGNDISDFGYGAIRTGVHYAADKPYEVSGVIDHNRIYQTPAYFAAAPEELLMDSGAIYISTRNDSVVVRDNLIHHINGPTYNRGIFADDGTSNLTVRGNRLFAIPNHYALDIDTRSAWKMLHRRDRKIDYVHEGIVVEDNQVDGKVRVPKKK